MHLPTRRPPNFSCVAIAACLSLAGCAATSGPPVTAQWVGNGSQVGAGFLRGATVMVACDAPDPAIREVCQDELAQALTDRGAKPVAVDSQTPAGAGRTLDDRLVDGARQRGAKALVVLALRPVAVDEGSGLSLSVGGFGFGRGSAVGGGITAPVGGSRVETAFAATGRVSDVGGARLLWTANAAGRPEPDVRSQMAALSSTILDAADRAGMF